MVVETGIYRDLAYIFAAALAGGLLARRLRQPLIIGYVLAGIAIGPFTPGPRLTGAHTLDLLAEIGVILLMYSIGIEFAPRHLAQVKGVALLGGPIGIALNILLAVAVGYLFGWSLSTSIAIGAILCVASTMVMSRLLIERGELTSLHGRIMIGITLVEDLAVIVMTVLLPVLGASSTEGRLWDLVKDIGKAAAVLIPLVFLAMRWVPSLMMRIARMRNPELYVLVVLALGLATAAVTQALGLSLALGAFMAGIILSETEVAHETLDRLQPLRDAFVALFFVTVGALIDPRALLKFSGLLAVLVGLIVIGKFVVWSAVVRLFGYPNRTAVLAGIGLTQIGEFSYVLVRVAKEERLVGDDVYNAVLAASLVTILLNAALLQWAPRRFKGAEKAA
jgi:CPA2 family monovalent cation:H+ antiporter-2